MRFLPSSTILRSLLLGSLAFGAACDSSATPSGDAGTTCEARAQAYEDFVAAHRSCSLDADCVVVGDCGPNADFASVRADSATEARTLQVARCSGTHDGPVYRAVCQAGTCGLEMRTDVSCGGPLSDASVGDGG